MQIHRLNRHLSLSEQVAKITFDDQKAWFRIGQYVRYFAGREPPVHGQEDRADNTSAKEQFILGRRIAREDCDTVSGFYALLGQSLGDTAAPFEHITVIERLRFEREAWRARCLCRVVSDQIEDAVAHHINSSSVIPGYASRRS